MINGVEELLTAKDVSRIFKVHWKTLVRWSRIGRFPKPIHLEGELRWRANEVWAHQQRLFQADQQKNFLGQKGTEGDSRDKCAE